VVPGLAPVAQAQEGSDEIEEIITTGTRRAERSASDSAIPIDVVTGQEFENMGTGDMDDMLRNTVPSYNVERQAISDAATLVRPATMRGLPPDNALVLVNGKRRHRSGVIAEGGGSLTSGSQGPDLASIPALAIKQVEVLRDGASAQYGSDAIAGVMNFVLRDAAEGFTVEARYGEFMEGDGAATQVAANAGFPLGDDGFANVTFQWREADPTSRSTQRTDAATLIASGNPAQQQNVRQPYAQIWGAPEYRDDWNVFLNSAIATTDSQEVYLFGNVGSRETEGGFFYRNPNNRGNVYTDGGIRAIVDTNITPRIGGQTSNCPALASPGSGADGNPLDANAVAQDWAALQALPANCWVMNLAVPGGYTPQFGGTLTDSAGVLGIRGEFNNGMSYDFSGSVGRNEVEFFLNNTWNPSNGPDKSLTGGTLQRNFEIGSYTQTDTNLNADFVYPIAVDAFASDLNFAFGAEWRNEQFQTRIGEEASWQAGNYAFMNSDPANPNFYADGMTQMINLSVGAHGFAGFSPPQAGRWDRANYALYADFEADMTDNFTLGVAVRFEDFDDFGTTTNGKIAARWGITDRFALRGSYSTGFRAPTPGQSNVTKISTLTIDGELVQSGQIPPTNPVATFLGGEQLKPEDAKNASVGVVWDITDTFSLTLDAYQIELKDRIARTGQIDITAAPPPPGANCPGAVTLAQCLEALGVPGASVLTSVSFYTNDFETTTTGMDLVATWDIDMGGAGNGNLVAAWNYTKTEVDAAGQEVSRNRMVDLENFNPQNRGIFT
jgi:iron complex outermembrane receptor protein